MTHDSRLCKHKPISAAAAAAVTAAVTAACNLYTHLWNVGKLLLQMEVLVKNISKVVKKSA
jgi:hypothetical protein